MWLDSLVNIVLALAAGLLEITLHVWNGFTIDTKIKDCNSMARVVGSFPQPMPL